MELRGSGLRRGVSLGCEGDGGEGVAACCSCVSQVHLTALSERLESREV